MLSSYKIPEIYEPFRNSLTELMKPFLTEARLKRMNDVVARRSRYVLPVFEATNHCHNISAGLRTVDALGFQDVFFVYTNIENEKFKISDSVERGSADWLFCRRLRSIEQCATLLKNNGYQIALVSLPGFFCTSTFFKHDLPHYASHDLIKPEVQKKITEKRLAIVFGNEKSGVSQTWGQWADMYISVDMFGFVESLNMSVCAGILLNELRRLVEHGEKNVANVVMEQRDKEFVLEHWICNNIDNGERIIERLDPRLIDYFRWQRRFPTGLLEV